MTPRAVEASVVAETWRIEVGVEGMWRTHVGEDPDRARVVDHLAWLRSHAASVDHRLVRTTTTVTTTIEDA